MLTCLATPTTWAFCTGASMKLLTHNMLTSHVKGVKNGYPLRLLAKQVVLNTIDFNAEFIARMLPKLDWGVLRGTAQSVSKHKCTVEVMV